MPTGLPRIPKIRYQRHRLNDTKGAHQMAQ